jgi:uncharacterized membrane protein YfcA
MTAAAGSRPIRLAGISPRGALDPQMAHGLRFNRACAALGTVACARSSTDHRQIIDPRTSSAAGARRCYSPPRRRRIMIINSLIEQIGLSGLMLAMLAIMAGAAAQATIGMGLNLFATGILALIDPVFVPGPVLVQSFLLSIAASARLRDDIDVREVGLAIGGLLAGTALAASILAIVASEHLSRLFGGLIVAAVAITTFGVRLPLTDATVFAASAASGIMGTIAGVHGPPIALIYQRASPKRIRATLLPFFAAASPISIGALVAVGLFGWRELTASLLLLPGLACGYMVAPVLANALSPATVRAAILAISAASGATLLFRG